MGDDFEQAMRDYRYGILSAMRNSPLSDGDTSTRTLEALLEDVAMKHAFG